MFSHNGASGPQSKTTLCLVEFTRRQHRGRSRFVLSQVCLVNIRTVNVDFELDAHLKYVDDPMRTRRTGIDYRLRHHCL